MAAAASLDSIVATILEQLVSPFISLMFILATLVFIYGVIGYLVNSGNEEAQSRARKHIIWGIIGLLIMFAAGGILDLFCQFFYDTDCKTEFFS